MEKMSLQEYKKQVRDFLLKTYNPSTTVVEDLMKDPDSYWQTLWTMDWYRRKRPTAEACIFCKTRNIRYF